jgi:FHA domain
VAASQLKLLVAADRAYHSRMAAIDAPDAEAVAFPVFCPERRFALIGGQLLIGRRSRSRGIEPEIDLTGPPEDAGVSHSHAALVSTPDGGWAVVDLGSSNGTYINDSTKPIEPNKPVPVKEGDQIHVGAWTTLTLLAG